MEWLIKSIKIDLKVDNNITVVGTAFLVFFFGIPALVILIFSYPYTTRTDFIVSIIMFLIMILGATYFNEKYDKVNQFWEFILYSSVLIIASLNIYIIKMISERNILSFLMRILLTILVTMIAIIIMHELNKRLSPLIKNERENF